MLISTRTFEFIDTQVNRLYSAVLFVAGLITSFGSTALYASAGTQFVFDAAVLGLMILVFFNAHFISLLLLRKISVISVRHLTVFGIASVSFMVLLGASILPIAEKDPGILLMFKSVFLYLVIGEAAYWLGKIWFLRNGISHRV